jgi:hypothetical protein
MSVTISGNSNLVLQVVNATFSTFQTTTSTTYQASGLTASITPTSSSSKILITGSIPFNSYGGSYNQSTLTLYRGATNLMTNGFSILSSGGSWENQNVQALNWLDSPATTSSTTYTVYFRASPTSSGTTARIFIDNYSASMTLMEIAV